MGLFVPRYLPQSGYTADIELLMEGFRRAERILSELDHENLDPFTVTRLAVPSTNVRAATTTHRSGAVLSMSQGAGQVLPQPWDSSEWLDVEDGAGAPLTLAVELFEATVLHYMMSIQYNVTNAALHSSMDLRLTVNGAPGGAVATDTLHPPGAVTTMYMALQVEEFLPLPAGSYVLGAKVRQRQNATTAASPQITVSQANGFAWGVSR